MTNYGFDLVKGTLKELAFSLVADELVAGSLLDDKLAVK